jgi:hypothetical protein
MEIYVCQFCKKELKNKNANAQHICRCPLNPNRKYKSETLGKIPWNKGLTKENNESINRASLTLKKGFKNGRLIKQQISIEGRTKLSKLAKQRGLGGYRPHPNKGQYYKNIWFDSNWEVKVAISLDKNNINWIRPHIGFVWTDCGKKYYPDFYLLDFDVYLDPKNDFLIKKDFEKIKQAELRNNIKVLVLTGHQLDWEIIKTLL